MKVEAEAEKEAAANRAAAVRLEAEGEAEAEKLRAEAARIRFEVEAAGQRAINEAANLLSSDQISLQTKMALLKVLPEVVREAAKPMEAIDSIKIIQARCEPARPHPENALRGRKARRPQGSTSDGRRPLPAARARRRSAIPPTICGTNAASASRWCSSRNGKIISTSARAATITTASAPKSASRCFSTAACTS